MTIAFREHEPVLHDDSHAASRNIPIGEHLRHICIDNVESRIDDGAFELGLTALVDGFADKFRRLKLPRTPA